MHLFVLYMKKLSTIFLLVSTALLLLFTLNVDPDITNPLTIGGFFALFGVTVSIALYIGLGPIKEKGRRLMWSGSLAVYSCYLVALSSLSLLTIAYVLVSSAVLTITLFLIEKSYAR